MPMALSAKNKAGSIDGKITRPNADDPKYTAWTRLNNMILSWILKFCKEGDSIEHHVPRFNRKSMEGAQGTVLTSHKEMAQRYSKSRKL